MRVKLTYANVTSTLALVVALGTGTAYAAVVVSNNNQVAQNTISGHAPPSGKHANLISGSVNGTDLSAAFKSSVLVHCPSGMQLGGTICFDATPHSASSWQTALSSCQTAGRRLPTVGELATVFDNLSAQQGLTWTDTLSFDGTIYVAAEVSQDSSRTLTVEDASIAGVNLGYRCVATPTN